MQVYSIFPFVGFCLIVILLFVKIGILKKMKIRVSAGKKIQKKSVLLYFIFTLIFVIWLFEIAKPIFSFELDILPVFFTKNFFENELLKITGAGFILISLILFAFTLGHFKNSLRFGLDENNPGKLITSGIFSLTRNPFFLSLDIYFFGTALIFPNLFFSGFCFIAIIIIHFFILKEEKFVQKVYGTEYKKYAETVRRYF